MKPDLGTGFVFVLTLLVLSLILLQAMGIFGRDVQISRAWYEQFRSAERGDANDTAS